jgi:large-conductance mechanosensitive channel
LGECAKNAESPASAGFAGILAKATAVSRFITVAMNFAILAFIIFLMIKQVAHLKNEALAALEPTTEEVLLL